MLQSIKDRIRGSRWLGYIIVGIISVPFALWGIQAYLRGGGRVTAVSVNGNEISAHTVERRVSQRRRLLSQRFGGKLPDAFSTQRLRSSVIDGLISETLLQQTAVDANLKVASQTVAAQIRQQRVFQRDGQFDRDLYRQRLQQIGLTPAGYEARVTADVRAGQLRGAITDSAFVLPTEALRVAQLDGEQRHVLTLEYPRKAIRNAVHLDDSAIQSWYDQHKNDFHTPERVRLAYIEMDLDSLSKQIKVGEQALRDKYQSSKKQYQQAATRKAAHILIKIPGDGDGDGDQAAAHKALAKARSLRKQIEQGASFATMAKRYSDDSGSAGQGGDLGYVSRDMMPKAFDQALFDLSKVGQISQPVRTRYGYHLIKLLGIHERKQKPFAQVRDQIARDLRRQKAASRFYEHVETLKNKAYEHPNGLEAAAEATGLTVHRSDWIARDAGNNDAQGIGASDAVRKAAFEPAVLKDGQNSNVLKIGKHKVVVVRVVDHRAPQPQPLKAVRQQVRAQLLAQRVEQKGQQWSKKISQRLDQGASPEQLAEGSVTLTDHGWIDASDQKTEPALVTQAFRMTSPAKGDLTHRATTLQNGNRAIVIVEGTRLPKVTDDVMARTSQRRQQLLAGSEFASWIAARRAAADIKRPNRKGNADDTEG